MSFYEIMLESPGYNYVFVVVLNFMYDTTICALNYVGNYEENVLYSIKL